jgi:hypothetical protein
VGGRRKLHNFELLISNGLVLTEDKVKPTEKGFFIGFALSSIIPWPLEVYQFPVVQGGVRVE